MESYSTTACLSISHNSFWSFRRWRVTCIGWWWIRRSWTLRCDVSGGHVESSQNPSADIYPLSGGRLGLLTFHLSLCGSFGGPTSFRSWMKPFTSAKVMLWRMAWLEIVVKHGISCDKANHKRSSRWVHS